MGDKMFEWSLTGLTALVVLWMVLGSIFVMAWGWAVIIGLVVEIVGGGFMLRNWGKRYMERE